MTYKDEASALGARADEDIAKANSATAAAQAETEAVELELTAAEKEIARLQAIIDAGTPPVPPTPVAKTLVGSSAGGNDSPADFEAYAARCGGLESIRSFSPPAKMPTNLSQTTAASSVGKRHIAHSFKGRDANIDVSCQSLIDGKDDAWIGSFLDSKPADQGLDVIWRHEPDEEKPTISTWVAAQKKMRKLVDAANARGLTKYGAKFKKIRFGANLMSWSANKVPDRIKDFYPGDGVWEFISWDGYSKKQPFNSPAEIFDACIAWNKAHGNLPFAIGEFGADGTTTTDRSAWIKAVCDYAKAHNALWCHYWNATTAEGNYVLSPADEKVLGAQS